MLTVLVLRRRSNVSGSQTELGDGAIKAAPQHLRAASGFSLRFYSFPANL